MRKFIFFLKVLLWVFVLGQWEILSAQGSGKENKETFFFNFQKKLQSQKNLQKTDQAWIEKTFKTYADFSNLLSDTLSEQTMQILHLIQNNQLDFSLVLYFMQVQQKLGSEYGFGSNFQAFQASLCQILEASKLKDAALFIQSMYSFLEHGCLSSTNSVRWLLNYNQFILEPGLRPSLIFTNIDLKAYAYNDSIIVYQTQGAYFPLRSEFSGEGGFVSWERIGENGNATKTVLSTYRINLKASRMEADSVLFYNTQYFTEPVPGKLEDKLTARKDLSQAAYPKFSSYTEAQLSKLFPGVNARGRFVQQGGKMYLGQKTSPTELNIIKENKLLARIRSENIILTSDRFSSPYASWIIYLGEDSLYHSSSEIKYDAQSNKLSIFHSKEVGVEVPFKDTYHAVNISTEALYWDITKGKIEIGLLKIPDRTGETAFVSFQNYDEPEFSKLSSAGDNNVLYVLKNLAIEYAYKEIPIYRCAEKFRMAEESVRTLLMEYSSHAVVEYEPGAAYFRVLPKLMHYMGASANLNDFDNLRLLSNTGRLVNAVLSVDSLHLDIGGIKSVLLSPKQNVYFLPNSNKIRLMKNRNMLFDGLVHSGSFDFKVKDAFFNYKDFTIFFAHVDTLQFSVNAKEEDENGHVKKVKVNTQIESFSGYLYIDSAQNKAGIKDFKEFPVFESTQPSYVYYEHDHIRKRAYKKEVFYFVVDTFRLSGLNNFLTDSIRLVGTLYSDNMFPPLREPLVLMPDYSLGFTKISPAEGWPVYNGKAQFYDTLILNHSGLGAKGRLDYLSSSSTASDFVFLPHRMQASLRGYTSTESEQYAFLYDARAQDVEADWDITRGVYRIKTQKEPIYLYKEKLSMKGNLYICDTSTRADGRIEFPERVVLRSSDFKLSKRSFSSDSLLFYTGLPERRNTLLSTDNFSARVDMDAQDACFEAKNLKDSIYLGWQKYIILSPSFRWDFTSNEFRFSLPVSQKEILSNLLDISLEDRLKHKLDGIEFLSMHRTQNNVSFVGSEAVFRLRDTTLSAYGIPYLLIADAAIAPEKACLEILKNAKIKNLERANLLFPYYKPNHHFCEALVRIKTASEYHASGVYDYKAPGLAVQPVFFDNIKTEAPMNSIAQTNLKEEDSLFMLNAAFKYSGQMKLFSHSEDIYLDGSAYLAYSCSDSYDQQFPSIRFRNYIRPDSVFIPMGDDIRNVLGERVGMGFYMESSGQLFASFLENIRSTDHPVLVGQGMLSFNKETGSYQLVKEGKEVFSYQLKDCILIAEGEADMALSLDPLKTSLNGQMIWDIKKSKIHMQSVAAFDFFLENSLQEQFADIFSSSTETPMENIADGMMYNYFEKHLSEKDFKRIVKEIETYGSYQKVPVSLEHTLLFSRLRWDWYPEEKMLISSSDAGLHLIDKKVVNKKLKACVVLSKSRRGDMIDFYFELSRYKWFYINYHRGLVQILSSDTQFNESIAALKPAKRKKKGFEIALSDMRKKNQFLTMIADIESENYYPEEDAYEEE